jgi:hypothetical protein
MMLWLLAGLLGALALAPLLIRAFRDLRDSPELRATLRAAAIGMALELIPLLLLLVRVRGQRRPRS